MSLTRDDVKTRKAKAVLRAQRQLEERLARIDWEEAVLIPSIEALKQGKAVPALGIDANAVFDIRVVRQSIPAKTDADPDPSK